MEGLFFVERWFSRLGGLLSDHVPKGHIGRLLYRLSRGDA